MTEKNNYSNLQAITKELSKKGTIIQTVDDLSDGYDFNNSIHTGSLLLDYMLGTGGLPRGGFIHIHGQYSHGKSTLAVNIARGFIERGLPVLYIDVENTIRNTGQWFFKKNQIDPKDYDKFIIFVPHDFTELARTLYKYVKEGKIPLVVIDTVAAISDINPGEESINDLGKPTALGKQARSVSELLRTLSAFRSDDTTILLLNQERKNIVTTGNPAYQPKYKAPGGEAMGFYPSLALTLHQMGKTVYTEQENGKAREVRVVVEKSKYFDRAVKSSTSLYFLRDGSSKGILGIDKQYDLVTFASEIGIITKSGSWLQWTAKDGKEFKGQGFHNFIKVVSRRK